VTTIGRTYTPITADTKSLKEGLERAKEGLAASSRELRVYQFAPLYATKAYAEELMAMQQVYESAMERLFKETVKVPDQ